MLLGRQTGKHRRVINLSGNSDFFSALDEQKLEKTFGDKTSVVCRATSDFVLRPSSHFLYSLDDPIHAWAQMASNFESHRFFVLLQDRSEMKSGDARGMRPDITLMS